VLPTRAERGMCAPQGGLKRHERFPVSDDGPRATVDRCHPERLIGRRP
jgi:hypothetical protein